jgi:hypothetical protein
MPKESERALARLDSAMPEYLPPCYWTSCAFSPEQTTIVHQYPFGRRSDRVHGQRASR